VFPPPPPFAQILPYLRIFVSTPVVEKTKTQALGGFFHKSKNLREITQNRMFYRDLIHILSFLLSKVVKTSNFSIQKSKSFKIYQNVLKGKGKIPGKEKTTKFKEINSIFFRL